LLSELSKDINASPTQLNLKASEKLIAEMKKDTSPGMLHALETYNKYAVPTSPSKKIRPS